ncbi:hypothetical protein ACIQF6_28845 [Kitasatospora sp. NPDC092948]|uniref:hypothetical protein n=1 Tax=Kitasatospora sp. NPDC092948 TaxID=3364088 RepID=UPI00382DEBE2
MAVSPRLNEKYRRTARFWPATREEPDGPLTPPAMQEAGAFVFTYVDGNTLVVSVDVETVHKGLVERRGTSARVPLHITVNGTTVFYEPSERSGHTAWRVVGPGNEVALFADDEVWMARRLVQENGGVLQFRRAGHAEWHNPGAPAARPLRPRRWRAAVGWMRRLAFRCGVGRWLR